MNWLREDLVRFGFRPVWFNAWHYEKQEQMFPALLETVRKQAIPSLFSMAGIKFRWRLLQRRAADNKLAATILLLLTVFLAGLVNQQESSIWMQTRCAIEQYFPTDNQQTAKCDALAPKNSGASQANSKEKNKPEDFWQTVLLFFPWLAPLYGLWKGMQSFSQPNELLSRFFNGGEQSQTRRETSFREQFARDFAAVTEALDRTLILFIDDLDRCQPKSVCEVMETVNFLASEGRCHIVFGIWREGVERAIGLSFADIAKEFAKIDVLRSGEENSDEAEIRRRYGQNYLEKLINIWVTVPSMNARSTEKLLIPDVAIDDSRKTTESWLVRLKKLAAGFLSHDAWRPQYWFLRLKLAWQNIQQSLVNIMCAIFIIDNWRPNNMIVLIGRNWRKPVAWLVRGSILVLFGSIFVGSLFFINRSYFNWEKIIILSFSLIISLFGLTYCFARQSFRKLIAWLLPKKPPSPSVIYYVAVIIFLVNSVQWSFELGGNFKANQHKEYSRVSSNMPASPQSANQQPESAAKAIPASPAILIMTPITYNGRPIPP